jgi:hypothetical protein
VEKIAKNCPEKTAAQSGQPENRAVKRVLTRNMNFVQNLVGGHKISLGDQN